QHDTEIVVRARIVTLALFDGRLVSRDRGLRFTEPRKEVSEIVETDGIEGTRVCDPVQLRERLGLLSRVEQQVREFQTESIALGSTRRGVDLLAQSNDGIDGVVDVFL